MRGEIKMPDIEDFFKRLSDIETEKETIKQRICADVKCEKELSNELALLDREKNALEFARHCFIGEIKNLKVPLNPDELIDTNEEIFTWNTKVYSLLSRLSEDLDS